MVKREVWVTKTTADALDKNALKMGVTSRMYDSVSFFQVINNSEVLMVFSRDITSSHTNQTVEDLVGKLILATLKQGLLWYDLVMIGIDYGMTQDEISAAINRLINKGMINLESTNDGPLFKFVKYGNVRTTQRVRSHRGEVVKDKKKIIQKMITKTVR
jgi:hypothetical protein